MSIVKRTGNVFAKRKKSSISSKKVGRSTNDPKSVLSKSGISVREIFLILSILVVAFFSLLLIKPYFQYIISAMILSFIFFPMYKKINHKFTNQSVASGVMIVLILLMVIIPISYVVSQLVVQTMSVMNNMDPSQTLNTTMLDEFTLTISNIVGQEILFDEFLAEFSSAGKDFVLSSAPQIFGSLTSIFLGLFIMLFIMFYLFKDGDTLVSFLLKLSPIKEENEHRLMEEFSKVTKGVIYGQIVIGIFQGTLAGIGYIAFGVPAPILLGFITLIASFLPFIGTGLIWAPICIFMIAGGNLWGGLLLAIYCMFIVSGIDNVIKPKLIGDKTGLHPVLVLLGVFGGLSMFGFIGFILGPMIIALMIILLKMYMDDYR